MTKFTWEHIHLRSPDPEATAEWYKDKLGADVIRSRQGDGSTRIDLNLSGQKVFIALAQPGKAADAPASPYLGLDHIGLTVDDIDSAARNSRPKRWRLHDGPHHGSAGGQDRLPDRPAERVDRVDPARVETVSRLSRPGGRRPGQSGLGHGSSIRVRIVFRSLTNAAYSRAFAAASGTRRR